MLALMIFAGLSLVSEVPQALFSGGLAGRTARQRHMLAARTALADPREVTRLIKTAPSVESLLSTLDREIDGVAFNRIHIGAAVTRLADLRQQISREIRSGGTYRALLQRLADAVDGGDLGVREAANAFWAVAKMKEEAPEFLQVMLPLVQLLEFYAPEMCTADISNVVWACGAHGLDGLRIEGMLERVLERAVDRADDFKAEELGSLLWAGAQLRLRAPQLLAILPVLSEVAEQRVRDMEPRGVSNAIWAVAKLRKDAPCLCTVLPSCLEVLPLRVREMNSQDLANIFWSLVALRGEQLELAAVMPLLVEAAVNRSGSANAQQVANTIWAAGQLGLQPDLAHPLCKALTSAAFKRTPRFSAQEYANLCWGLALCSWRNETVMQQLAVRVTEAVATWHGKDILFSPPMVMLSCAKLGIRSAGMMRAIAQFTLPTLLRFDDWQLCSMAWSYDELDTVAEFTPFREQLHGEIARRGIPPERVPLCQAGPVEWRRS